MIKFNYKLKYSKKKCSYRQYLVTIIKIIIEL